MNKIREIENSAELAAIRNYRHRYIAHPIYRTLEERKKGEIRRVSIKDIDYVLNASLGLISTLEEALSVPKGDYEAARVNSIRESTSFLDRLSLQSAVLAHGTLSGRT